MTKTIKNTAKKLISLAAAACKALKASSLAFKEKTKRRLQKLPARIFRSLKTARRQFIKWQDKISFEGKAVLIFIFAVLFISIVKDIESILQIETFSYQNILGIYGILGGFLGALFIFTAAKLWKKFIKLKNKVLFDGKIVLIFTFAVLFISVSVKDKDIENVLQAATFSYKNILGIYGILGAFLGAVFIFKVAKLWKKFIKLQGKILFDGKIALIFIFAALFISIIVKDIESVLQVATLSYQHMLGIYAILGALLGALFIFTAAEGLRDRNEKYKVRILLNSSKLNTLILLFLLSLIPLIFPQLHVFSLSALISFIIFSGYSVYQILSMLLNIEVLLNKEINLFRKGIKKATDFVTDCRSKNKELLKRMKENQIKLQYICVFPPFFINFEMLKIEKEGIVTDIDLDKLKSIAGKIDKAITAASRKKALSDAQIIPESSANSQINMPEPQRDPKPKEKNFSEQISESKYFSILVGNSIKEETPILSFDKNIQIDKSKIQKQLKQAVTVEKSTVVLEVKAELEEFKIMMEKFIKAKNFNQFKRRFDSYFEMAKIFLTCLSEKNQLYSYQEAKTDSGMALGEASSWPPLSWLTDHVMSFFEKAREIKKTGDSESKNIYEEIKWLSYRLMIFSKEKNDHLLFQKSLALWQRQFYILSKGKVDEKEIKDHVNFFRNYIITPVFFETIEEGIKEERKNYAVFLLEIIKGVFESALSQNLSCLFPHIAKIIRHISEKPFSTEPSYYRSFANIKYLAISPLAFKSPESYESKRLQFLFGLGAYLESQSNSELNHIKEVIRDSIPRLRFADLENYLKIYPLMMSAETEKFWHWIFLMRQVRKEALFPQKMKM